MKHWKVLFPMILYGNIRALYVTLFYVKFYSEERTLYH